MTETAISLAVIASFVLAYFGIRGLRRGGESPQKHWLMIGVAIVTLINAYLLATMPKPA
ncbi:MAG: hypothetical protein Tsb0016_08080 [Sphingomonadales bacterium]